MRSGKRRGSKWLWSAEGISFNLRERTEESKSVPFLAVLVTLKPTFLLFYLFIIIFFFCIFLYFMLSLVNE